MIANMIFFFVLLAGCVYAAARYGKRFEEILPISILGIIVILFLFGIIGQLKLGVLVVIFAAVALYMETLRRVTVGGKARTEFAQNFLTPPFFVFCIFYIVLNVCNYGMQAHDNDEFSHWMDCVKAMTHIDDFVTNPAAMAMFPSYPPGMALIQYFFQKIYAFCNSGALFNEWRMYLAYQVVSLSLMFPFLKDTSFNKPVELILLAILVFIVPITFFAGFYSVILIDAFVGLLSGCGFAMVLLSPSKGNVRLIYVLLVCSVLVLAKDVGLLFSCMIAAGYVIDTVLSTENRGRDIKFKRNITVKAFLPLLSTVCTKVLWSLNIRSANARIVFGNKIDLVYYSKMFFNRVVDTSYRQQVVDNFKKEFLVPRFSATIGSVCISISSLDIIIAMLVLLWVTCFLLIKTRKEPIKSNSAWMITILLSVQLVIYMYSLGATYVSNFSENEALKLAAYNRYLALGFQSVWPVVVLSIVEIVRHVPGEWKRLLVNIVMILGIVAVADFEYCEAFLTRDAVRESQAARSMYNDMEEEIHINCDGDDLIYVISQGAESSMQNLIVKYISRPSSTASECGRNFSESNENEQASPAELRQVLLERYDYVAIYNVDDYFVENYDLLFANTEKIGCGLYYINKNRGLLEKCKQ